MDKTAEVEKLKAILNLHNNDHQGAGQDIRELAAQIFVAGEKSVDACFDKALAFYDGIKARKARLAAEIAQAESGK